MFIFFSAVKVIDKPIIIIIIIAIVVILTTRHVDREPGRKRPYNQEKSGSICDFCLFQER